jgi:hypothetical protein
MDIRSNLRASCLAALLTGSIGVSSAPLKADIVYLIITQSDHASVGDQVWVHPLFVTDGSRMEFITKVCFEADPRRKASFKKLPQIVLEHCGAATAILPDKTYRAFNNLGEMIELESFDFITHTKASWSAEEMIWTGTALIKAVAPHGKGGQYQRSAADRGPEIPSFYLMSLNAATIRQILPQSVEPNSPKTIALTADSESLGRAIIGKARSRARIGGVCKEFQMCDQRTVKVSPDVRSQQLSTSYYDYDFDGGMDALVSLRATVASNQGQVYEWRGMMSLSASGAMEWIGSIEDYELPSVHGASDWYAKSTFLPAAVVKIKSCMYAITVMDALDLTYGLVGLPFGNDKCVDQLASNSTPEE